MILDIWGRSHYHKHKNKTLEWCPGDTKELFDVHMADKESRTLLDHNNWVDREIEYKFNEYGYRCDSWNNDLGCRVLFAGCSQTMGIGLPLDMLWASRIAEYLRVPYHNIACGGSDWQHVTQRLVYWIPKLRPAFLIMKEPPTQRFNWWDGDTAVQSNQFTEEELINCRVNDSRPLVDIVQYNNSEWYKWSMKQLIQQLCTEYRVRLISIPTGRLNYDADYKKDLARDLNHFGQQEQDYTFELVKRIFEDE